MSRETALPSDEEIEFRVAYPEDPEGHVVIEADGTHRVVAPGTEFSTG